VKLSTLLEIIGSGSLLLVLGIGILLLGVGYGFTAATQVPLWASLCGIGILTAIVGGVLLDRGSVEAEAQVTKKIPRVMEVIRSPWWTVGASVLGGLFLQRLLRGQREIIVENIVPMPKPETFAAPNLDHQERAELQEEKGFSVSEYVGDQLRSLGSIASGMAVSFALKSLGVPTVKELISELLSGEKHSERER